MATAGGRLLSWSAREVDHRPGHSTTVSYRARVSWVDGERSETLGASTGLSTVRDPQPGVIAVTDGEREVAVWKFPLDPGLPALVTAYDQQAVSALFASVGLTSEPVRIRTRAYRPGRRAVVEVSTPGARLFLKVVRPRRVAGMHERHRLLHEAGVPVARSLGWSDDGLLVLAALEGMGMRQCLRDGAVGVPSATDLLEILDGLPASVRKLSRHSAWSDDVGYFARIVGAALPAEAGRSLDLAGRIQTGLVGSSDPVDAVHGDLYEGQLLLRGGRFSGLLDVDTVGPGRRADDLACVLAHLGVMAQVDPASEATTQALAARWLSDFQRHVDAVELRYRVGGVLMSLATGPHRVQQTGWRRVTRDRLDLAQAWVRSAERMTA